MGRCGDAGLPWFAILASCVVACAPRVDLIDAEPGEGGSGGDLPTSAGGSGGNTGGVAGSAAGGGSVGLDPPVGAAGTASAGTGPSAGAGAGAAGSAPVFPTTALLSWTEEGGINENQFGIFGGWYSFDDCGDAPTAGLPCTERDPEHVGPDGLAGWWIESTSEVCARGLAPRVDTSVPNAYALQWGLGVGFTLAGGSENQPMGYDAVAHDVIGFVFDVTGSTQSGLLRFNVTTPPTQSAPHHIELQVPVQNRVIYLDELDQGPWITDPVPLTSNSIDSVQFHVATNELETTAFDLCVRNLRVLRAP